VAAAAVLRLAALLAVLGRAGTALDGTAEPLVAGGTGGGVPSA
jgi:hypothetical protein